MKGDSNLNQSLRRCVDSLPNKRLRLRDIVYWHTYEQKSFTIIGKLLGKKRHTIHWRFHEKAIPSLLQCLHKQGWDEKRILALICKKERRELPSFLRDSEPKRYIGVISTKKFHLCVCPYLVLLKEKPIYFLTRRAAIKKGFKPCRRCLPPKNSKRGTFKFSVPLPKRCKFDECDKI